MRKFVLSAAVTVVFVGYSLSQRYGFGNGGDSVKVTPMATSSTVMQPQMGGTMQQNMMGASGTYTGDTVDAYYGYVQVSATLQNGRITEVKFLQYPNDRSTSRRINSVAMPYLTQEAINAQSAQVNVVSGATFTSRAFIQSLQSALNKVNN